MQNLGQNIRQITAIIKIMSRRINLVLIPKNHIAAGGMVFKNPTEVLRRRHALNSSFVAVASMKPEMGKMDKDHFIAHDNEGKVPSPTTPYVASSALNNGPSLTELINFQLSTYYGLPTMTLEMEGKFYEALEATFLDKAICTPGAPFVKVNCGPNGFYETFSDELSRRCFGFSTKGNVFKLQPNMDLSPVIDAILASDEGDYRTFIISLEDEEILTQVRANDLKEINRGGLYSYSTTAKKYLRFLTTCVNDLSEHEDIYVIPAKLVKKE